jgi:hypothetical protein
MSSPVYAALDQADDLALMVERRALPEACNAAEVTLLQNAVSAAGSDEIPKCVRTAMRLCCCRTP